MKIMLTKDVLLEEMDDESHEDVLQRSWFESDGM